MVNLLSSPLRILNPVPIRAITCTDTCLVSRGHGKDGKAQECCLCGESYHYICVGITRKPAVWFCAKCKGMPDKLQELTKQVERQCTTIGKQQVTNTALYKQITTLTNELKTLKSRPADAPVPPQTTIPPKKDAADTKPNTKSKPTTTAPSKPTTTASKKKEVTTKNLLIGDSMIGDINPRGLTETTVKCLRGAKIAKVSEELANMSVHSFDAIILHVGTNNCTSDTEVDAGAKDLDALLHSLNQRAPNTLKIVSSIIPRRDNKEHQARVERLNSKITDSAKVHGCIHIDHDPNFKLQNGNIDEHALHHRGLHLSRAGTSRLLRDINATHPIVTAKDQRASPSSDSPRSSRSTHQATRREHGHHHQHRHHQQGAAPDHDHETRYRSRRPNHDHRDHAYGQHARHNHDNYDGCHFCGSFSHTKRDCRYGEAVECYECGNYGHLSYFCKPRNARR